jgi:hypothetical protein
MELGNPTVFPKPIMSSQMVAISGGTIWTAAFRRTCPPTFVNKGLVGLRAVGVLSPRQSPRWMQRSEIIISACAAISGEEHFGRWFIELVLKAKPKG